MGMVGKRSERRRFGKLGLGVSAALILLVLYFLTPYVNGFFQALILYVILKPSYDWLTLKRGQGRSLSAYIVIMLSVFLIIIPFFLAASLVFNEVRNAEETIVAVFNEASDYLEVVDSALVSVDVTGLLRGQIDSTASFMKGMLSSFVESLAHFFINITITYFLLYYFLVDGGRIGEEIRSIIPFSKRDTEGFITEFKNVTYSTVIGTGVIAFIQGSLLTVVFYLFGLPAAFFWGFICFILSVMPVVGAPIIWLPAAVSQFLIGENVAGLGVLVGGLIISSVDNFIRPFIQNKIGRLHPLTTLLGVIIGVPNFGVIGVIVGPLIISYSMITMKIIREEYIQGDA
ncbi:MAG: AI-2E family transporter [Candidatus Altiarchaeales archaeon]|nr:AI-2E family transporter [Candidatus Altiarchaeales archaeon]MBD3416891.1 AI-2E family transporter [Candidatus Altiarchaeales archaeon]